MNEPLKYYFFSQSTVLNINMQYYAKVGKKINYQQPLKVLHIHNIILVWDIQWIDVYM